MSFIHVTFVRHGETELNRQQLIHSHSDASINETGIKQAHLLGNYLKDEKFTRAFSSDMSRAIDTCRIALEHSNHPTPEIVHDKDIREKSFGDWEGRPNADIFEELTRTGIEFHRFVAPGGETWEETSARGMKFFQKLCRICDENNGDPENIIVVTHGLSMLSILMALDADDAFDFRNFSPYRFTNPNTGRTKLQIHKPNESGVRLIHMECLTDGSHLN